MRRAIVITPLVVLMFLPLQAQTSLGAAALLKHALYLADLYNWADAAAEFGEAEKLFL